MKKAFKFLTLFFAFAMVCSFSFDADAQTRTKARTAKTARKAQPVRRNVNTTLPNTAYDETNPANQGERLCDFLDKWIADPQFRQANSKNLRQANYYEGEVSEFGEMDPLDLYQAYVEGFQNSDWEKMIKHPYKNVVMKGSTELSGERSAWDLVNNEYAVLTNESWDDESDMGGGMIQFIFRRVNGQWCLWGVCAAG